jgi:branched-chain amino acid transport system ATP-binding protein
MRVAFGVALAPGDARGAAPRLIGKSATPWECVLGPLLHAIDIEKSFDGIRAVDGCSIMVEPHSITGLIGPNGAGKTTLFNLLSGMFRPDRGQVVFSGEHIEGLPPHRIVRKGLTRTFQIPRELMELTVLENMMLFPNPQVGEWIWRPILTPRRVASQEREIREKAESVLTFVELIDLKDEPAKNLSGGQKKILELARTLMSDPKMILLDEPGAGVNPTLMKKLSRNILALREQGKTFLLIEHDMNVITTLSDHVVVMAKGQVLAEGTFDEVKKDARVLDAYLAG